MHVLWLSRFHCWIEHNPGTAAWVQAGGSIVGLIVGVGVPLVSFSVTRQENRRLRARALKAQLIMSKSTVDGLSDSIDRLGIIIATAQNTPPGAVPHYHNLGVGPIDPIKGWLLEGANFDHRIFSVLEHLVLASEGLNRELKGVYEDPALLLGENVTKQFGVVRSLRDTLKTELTAILSTSKL